MIDSILYSSYEDSLPIVPGWISIQDTDNLSF